MYLSRVRRFCLGAFAGIALLLASLGATEPAVAFDDEPGVGFVEDVGDKGEVRGDGGGKGEASYASDCLDDLEKHNWWLCVPFTAANGPFGTPDNLLDS